MRFVGPARRHHTFDRHVDARVVVDHDGVDDDFHDHHHDLTTTTTLPAASPPIVTDPRGRVDVPGAPAYSAATSNVTAADLGSSYHAGCAVGPDRLRRVQLTYWGFDAQLHTGTLVVNADAVNAVVAAFHRLYDERFPIRRMETVDKYGADDRASMAADNTSAFNCRPVAGSNPPRWSAHAFGHAIDVDTIENPDRKSVV